MGWVESELEKREEARRGNRRESVLWERRLLPTLGKSVAELSLLGKKLPLQRILSRSQRAQS